MGRATNSAQFPTLFIHSTFTIIIQKKGFVNMSKKVVADLESVFPQTKTLTIQGREVEVKPFKFKQLLAAIKHLGNIVGDVVYIDEYVLMTQVIKGLGNNPEDVVALMKLGTGITEESFYDNLEEDEGFEILVSLWEVNKDFFVQKVGSKVKSLSGSQSESTNEGPSEQSQATIGQS